MKNFKRACGSCTSCCSLVPVESLKKPAGQRCRFQRIGRGCAIYSNRPLDCRAWSCKWLTNDDTADLRRPDFSHYVVDMIPDFITIHPEGHPPLTMPIIQVWCDPNYPEAWRDPKLLEYLERRGKEGFAALIRYGNERGISVFPPSITGAGWVENAGSAIGKEDEHSFDEIMNVIGKENFARAVLGTKTPQSAD